MSLRSRASFMQTISGPIGEAFKQQQPTPWQDKSSPNIPQSTPRIQFTSPTPGMTLVHPSTDDKVPTQEAPGLFLSGELLSSSPKSANIELNPAEDSSLFLRSPLSEHATMPPSPRPEIALSTTISRRTAHYHPMLTTQGPYSL